jgi:dihydropteroate synthase
VVPVVESLAPHVRVSVDTDNPYVAVAAIEAGASLINDISASLWEIAADAKCGWIAMHMRGTPKDMQLSPRYDDVVSEVGSFLAERAELARQAGVPEVWIDPGIGFGKTSEHSVALLRDLGRIVGIGSPVLVGTSRKSFLGKLAPGAGGEELPADERLPASLATATWAMLAGASMVRVHDVAATVHAAHLVGSSPAPQVRGQVGA